MSGGGRLEGRIAFVTGTGGSHGRAAALLFAREGAEIVGVDVDERAAEETVALVHAAGGRMTSTAPVDLADPKAAAGWIAAGVDAAGGIDVLYNNAGAMRPGTITSTTFEDWSYTLRNELDLIFTVTAAAWPHLLARGGGSIINTASVVAHRATGGMIAHAAAKGGVLAITRQLAAEGAPHGIRCNSISPGMIETPATVAVLERFRRPDGTLPVPVPLGRLGTADDVAHLALYLASDESSWVTAVDYAVDGGVMGIRPGFT